MSAALYLLLICFGDSWNDVENGVRRGAGRMAAPRGEVKGKLSAH
jgi:hypothetical protein